MLFLTNFQHINGSFMKKQTPMKTNDIDENNLLYLVGKQFSSKTCLTTLDFYSVAFLILLTTFFQMNFIFACLFNFYWISPNKKFVLHKY